MKKCINCQKEIIDTAKFCKYCGAKQEPEKKFCIECGKKIDEDSVYCEYCGAKQDKQKNTTNSTKKKQTTTKINTVPSKTNTETEIEEIMDATILKSRLEEGYHLQKESEYKIILNNYSKDSYMCICIGDYLKDKKKDTEAVSWYKKGIEKGQKRLSWRLGKCYEEGFGVKQDYKKAVELYEASANLGDDEAMYLLSVCYREGKGVEKSSDKMDYWNNKAAKAGNPQAGFNEALLEFVRAAKAGLFDDDEEIKEAFSESKSKK